MAIKKNKTKKKKKKRKENVKVQFQNKSCKILFLNRLVL